MSIDEELLKTKIDVLSNLRTHKINVTDRMKQAFLNVPREEFVLEKYRERAYIDTPLPILSGQTISAIHMVMIYISSSCSDPQIGHKILEVGAGSGYNAAMFAEMVAPEGVDNPGHVYAVEIIPELVEFAKNNIERTGYTDRVTIIQGDGGIGYPSEGPYDIISVAAASKRIPPPLQEQLKTNGKLIIPVGRMFYQELVIIERKSEKDFSERSMGGVAFVPLTGKYG
ncbi:MAG: protein-L-isoaspartate(D-aspartate) O-methyltransferase [Candidatus Heimdallarchaeota archaeon]|nr:protein-L-isoaspartate(D-aspartate) O-methyltransferase [Candidatus Heimdallarchaeota archaeon]MCK4876425.1 protein-L-isoaspartate(D-aspartate) O-methyltransferase [Candidatus Heimdallarchaeota archaeon]